MWLAVRWRSSSRAYVLPATTVDFFTDDAGKVYEDAANRLAQAGLTQGCAPNLYCGDDTITRGEMAAFLSRAENLPDSTTDHFVDDDSSIFQPGINEVADARITLGCNPPANTNFCRDDNVTRGQMAGFLTRALRLTPIIPPPPATTTTTAPTTTSTPVPPNQGDTVNCDDRNMGGSPGLFRPLLPLYGDVAAWTPTTTGSHASPFPVPHDD